MSFLCKVWHSFLTMRARKKSHNSPSPGRQLLPFRTCIEKTSLLRGSMTVEASVVLPCFLFFFINLSSSLEMIRLQSNILYALNEAGNEVCLYGSLLTDEVRSMGQTGHVKAEGKDTKETSEDEEGISDLIGGVLLSQTYVKQRIEDNLGVSYLEGSPLKYGSGSLNFLGSRIGDGDIVDIKLSAEVGTPVPWVSPGGFSLPWRYYGHLWNGYEVTGDGQSLSQEKIVYITDDSEVYHTTTTCTHLKLTIRAVGYSELADIRNTGGGRYYPCEICAKGDAPEVVYVGVQGDRYHYSDDCYTLTRSYTAVPLSEVEDSHRPCSRCGGG